MFSLEIVFKTFFGYCAFSSLGLSLYHTVSYIQCKAQYIGYNNNNMINTSEIQDTN